MIALTSLYLNCFWLQARITGSTRLALVIYGGFDWFEYLVNPFVLAILLGLIYGVFTLWRYSRSLRAQGVALAQVRENYERVEKNQERNPDLVISDLLSEVNPHSLAAQRVVELHRISINAGEFDQTALAEVLAAREASKTSISRYIASVLVLLGLCGAIWGLSHLIFQMSPALTQVQEQLDGTQASENAGASAHDNMSPVQESFKTLINTMSTSLANTRSAFYASLTGILASVLLLFFNWYTAGRQIKFLAEMEELTATRLIPVFRPPREASELAHALEAFKDGSHDLVRLSDDLNNKVEQVGGSLDNLFAIVRKFGESSESLRSNQERVYEAQSQMIQVVAEFRDFMSRIETHQAATKTGLDAMVGAVGLSNQTLGRALDDWRGKHEEMLGVIQKNSEQSSSEAATARDTAQHGINELARLMQESVEQQVGALRAQALDVIDKQQSGATTHLEKLLKHQGEFVTELKNTIGSSDGHQELLAGMAKTMEEERSIFSERIETVLRHSDVGMKAVLAEQQKILDVSGMKRVEERLEEFVQGSQMGFASLVKRQEVLDKQFSELGKQAGRLGVWLRLLVGVATASIPVFAALGIMFIFDLKPVDQLTKILALLLIIAMIGLIAWFLRSKT